MRHLLPLCLVLLVGCPQSLTGGVPEDDAGAGLPPNRDIRGDAGAPDGGPPGGGDAGTPDAGPPGDGGQVPDAGPGAACVIWEDCPPHFGDPNSGFACVDEQCACDPQGAIGQGCAASGGFWDPAACYCSFLQDEPVACAVWQDCPPHHGSLQSGYECLSQQCTCDPSGTYQANCAGQGGYWIAAECYCAFNDVGPPSQAPEPDCWWHLVEPVCDPDRWVDTSRYEAECYYDHNDDYVCDQIWVSSGYWEPGACPAPYWDQRCYG